MTHANNTVYKPSLGLMKVRKLPIALNREKKQHFENLLEETKPQTYLNNDESVCNDGHGTREIIRAIVEMSLDSVEDWEPTLVGIIKNQSNLFFERHAPTSAEHAPTRAELERLRDSLQSAQTLQDMGSFEIQQEETAIVARPLIEFINLCFDESYRRVSKQFFSTFGDDSLEKVSQQDQWVTERALKFEGNEAAIELDDDKYHDEEEESKNIRSRYIFPARIDMLGGYVTTMNYFWNPHHCWLQIGDNGGKNYRWKVHISAWPSSTAKIFSVIYPYLLELRTKKTVFKFSTLNPYMRSVYLMSYYMMKSLALTQTGKWITIYPKNDGGEDSAKIAKHLDGLFVEAIEKGTLKHEDFATPYGDAIVGESGGVFSRDERMDDERRYPCTEKNANTHPFGKENLKVTFRGRPLAKLNQDDIKGIEEEWSQLFLGSGRERDPEVFNRMRSEVGHIAKRPENIASLRSPPIYCNNLPSQPLLTFYS
ncbi:hypothetical protein AGMMS49949_02430 [Alphaproteobacteria bacterium]|nr:hypothetical protein AGMMS49949_02430 [Alphaproteobacteria bacterium]